MPGEFIARNGMISRGNVVVTGSLTTSGSLTTTGTITATTLVVQTITSSISSITGSTNFGSLLANTHVFTGSMSVTGSLAVVTTGTEFQVNPSGVNLGNALTDSHVISGSLRINPSTLIVSSSGNVGIGTSPNTTAGITELAIGSSNTNPLISGIRDGVSAFSLSSASGGTSLLERRNLDLTIGTNNTTRLTIAASTGAATFVSSVAASTSITVTNSGAQAAILSAVSTFADGYRATLRLWNQHTGGKAWEVYSTNNSDGGYSGGKLAFVNSTDSVTAMTLTSGGLVGIGITNPSGSLSIKAETSNTPTLVFQPATSVAPSAISNFLGTNQTFTVIGSNAYVNNAGGITRFNASYAGCFIAFDEGEIGFSSGTNGANPSQRIRILSGGDVNITGGNVRSLGGSYVLRDPANTLTGGLLTPRRNWLGSGTDYSPTIAAETGYGIYTYTNGTTSPSGPYVAVGGTTWTNGSSDVRKKKNFETTQGLAEILQIEPIKYHFNEDDNSSKKRLGFKAQNILPLIPEMVSETGELAEDESPYLTINPDYILPVLVKAIQELTARVQELENK